MHKTTRGANGTGKRAAHAYCCCTALALAIAACLPVYTASAQTGTAEATIRFDIPAGDLAAALERFSTQSGIQLLYRNDLVAGKRTRAVTGALVPAVALQRLLEGSGVESERLDGTTFVLKPSAVPATARPPAASAANAQRNPEPEEVQELEKLTVTGTRIRGGSTPSPVITIGAQQIREEGFTDLGDVIRSVPQNFNGGQNPGVVDGARSGAGGMANQNLGGGSGLNLRGLGPDATLTLLNGRRLSYGGFVQAVDISAIPVEAVDRIEIVADGASAIYGSDAVAGVGNVILRREYDGVTVGVRYGGATEGGLATREYTVTAGTTWSNGGLIATYKNASNDPIHARQRHYTAYMFDRANIWPEGDLRSGLVSMHQSIGDAVELRLDALRTERDQTFYPYNTGLLPTYRMVTTDAATTLISPSIHVMLRNDWTLQLGVVRANDEVDARDTRVNIATGTPQTLIDECYCNDLLTLEAGAEGPLFALPGGDARLAVGAGYRKNEFTWDNYRTGVKTIEGEGSTKFAYAEINLPVVSPDQDVSGVRRLALTGAVRGEDYDSFGGVVTPKMGLIYGPNAGLTLKASWGKSFKAPTNLQRFWPRQAALALASFYNSDYAPGTTILISGGGNRSLEAERATTWSASLVFHPEALPGLDTELTWFDIDYTDRVVEPLPNYGQALRNPDRYAQFISFLPSIQEQDQVIDSSDAFTNSSGQTYDPNNVVAILYARYTNVARQRIKGLDLSATYRLDIGAGRLTVRGSSSWLDSSQQSTPNTERFDLAGVIFSPAKISSRVGAVWTQGGWSASGFVNYTGGVTNNLVVDGSEKTSSFTTFDATVRYATSRESGWAGWDFALSAQNLFNREPPLYTPISLANPPYDSTNYSAVGRFLSASISRRF